ncbi:MAG: alpha/beta hydrolase family protein [Anaerolineae bacterium]
MDAALSGGAEYVYPRESGLDVYILLHKIVVRTAQDVETLIAHFAEREEVDGKRIGVTGFSMGGFASFYLAANVPDIKAAVPIAGVPAFADRWCDVVLEASAYGQWSEAMTAAQTETVVRTAYIESIDPFEKLSSFHPKPLMMIQGDKDTDAPKIYAVDLYRALKPRYADHPERLRLNIHDGAGHELTQAMIDDACAWFQQYLSP